MPIRIEVMKKDQLPKCLQGLSRQDEHWINDQLLNNEVGSDDELKQHFIEGGLSEEQASAAISLRAACVGASPSLASPRSFLARGKPRKRSKAPSL